MESDRVIRALSALAQEHRLAAYRLLVQAGEGGLAAGAIADMGYLTENCCGGVPCAGDACLPEDEKRTA